MERQIVGRGLLAGALAGVLAFLYARVFVEPLIGRAVDYEAERAHVAGAMNGTHEHGMELFTRDVQAWAGMGFGVLAYSVAVAALFTLAFIVVYPRCPGLSARMTAALLAAAAFVTVYLVPFLKYPASPPSIGEGATIKERSGLYLLMVLASVVLAAGALWLARRLAPRLGPWAAALSAMGGYLLATGMVMWALPSISETPQPLTDQAGRLVFPGFPADDLYWFRLHTVGTQVVIWATIGLAFGALVSRLLEDQRRQPITV